MRRKRGWIAIDKHDGCVWNVTIIESITRTKLKKEKKKGFYKIHQSGTTLLELDTSLT